MPLLVNLKKKKLVQSDLRLVGFKITMIFYLFFFFPALFFISKLKSNFKLHEKNLHIIVRKNESYKEITNK